MNSESSNASHPEIIAEPSVGRVLRTEAPSTTAIAVDVLEALDPAFRAAEAASELYSGSAEFLPESARTARRVAALGSLVLTNANVYPSFDGAQLFANYQARHQEPYDIGPDCE